MATRNISIGLLKPTYSPDNCLVAGHGLDEVQSTHPILSGGRHFTRSRIIREPWWVDYLAVPDIGNLRGADGLSFFPIDGRWCYLNFGFAYHKIDNEALEYDFGMRAAAVLVDSDALRSTDSLEPSVARRRRTQVARSTEATTFGMDARAALMKGLVGKAKKSLNKKVKQITGGAHLKVGCSASSDEIYYVLADAIRAYLHGTIPQELQDYLQVRPVDDPVFLSGLEQQLVDCINARDREALSLLIPDTVEYGTRDHVKFAGLGRHPPSDDIFVGALFDYINGRIGTQAIDADRFRRLKLIICDDEGNNPLSYPLERSLFFEANLPGQSSSFFFSEGKWYEVSNSLIQRLTDRLHGFFDENDYPIYSEEMTSEADYNENLAEFLENAAVLDKTDILPWTHSKIEPCDVAQTIDDQLILYHVKRNTTSSSLSHLLNQGINSWRVIRDDEEVRNKFLELCEGEGLDRGTLVKAIDEKKIHIRYVITTHKPLDGAENNLPIFSRISADRIISEAHDTGVRVTFTYVQEPKSDDEQEDEEIIEQE